MLLVDEPTEWRAYFCTDVSGAEELVDRSDSPSESCGQAASVALCDAGRRDSCGSEARGEGGGNSGGRRQAARPGRMTYIRSQKVPCETDFKKNPKIWDWEASPAYYLGKGSLKEGSGRYGEGA